MVTCRVFLWSERAVRVSFAECVSIRSVLGVSSSPSFRRSSSATQPFRTARTCERCAGITSVGSILRGLTATRFHLRRTVTV